MMDLQREVFTRIARPAAVLLGTMIAAFTAGAQSIRGTVTDGANQPVPSVVVLLLDSTSQSRARALTDDRGAFRFREVSPGRYRLSTLRIGYVPTHGPTFSVSEGEEVVQRLVLSGAQVRLDTMRVTGKELCEGDRDSSTATFMMWDQVRAALTATQVTTAERSLYATTVNYDRYYDPEMRTLRGQRVQVHSDSVRDPWQALPPDSLHRYGYVVAGDSVTFYAPGLEALLSPTFTEDHCFRIAESKDPTRLGLAFDPTVDRKKIPELTGTLWLDRQTSELRQLEYAYTNLPRGIANGSGGAMSFARIGSVGWLVSEWSIRMPMVTPGSVMMGARASVFTTGARVTGAKVTGGELALALAGGDTVWRRSAAAFTIAVIDSLTGRGIPGAEVELAEAAVETVVDSAGRATIADLLIGNYTLIVRTPDLDSLGIAFRSRISVLDSAQRMTVRVPNAARVAARGGSLSGTVVSETDKTPVIAAEVSLPELGMATRTDGNGAFRFDHIGAGKHQVTVRRISFAPLAAELKFATNKEVKVVLELDPVAVLDSVVVTDRATASIMASFDEHRRIGLGTFFTRDSLAKLENGTLAEVLAQVTGIDERPLFKQFEIAMSKRLGCRLLVYLDHLPIYRGPGDVPFNLNTISPSAIEAIEVYPGSASVPLEYQGLNTQCGVLVIWTRRTP